MSVGSRGSSSFGFPRSLGNFGPERGHGISISTRPNFFSVKPATPSFVRSIDFKGGSFRPELKWSISRTRVPPFGRVSLPSVDHFRPATEDRRSVVTARFSKPEYDVPSKGISRLETSGRLGFLSGKSGGESVSQLEVSLLKNAPVYQIRRGNFTEYPGRTVALPDVGGRRAESTALYKIAKPAAGEITVPPEKPASKAKTRTFGGYQPGEVRQAVRTLQALRRAGITEAENMVEQAVRQKGLSVKERTFMAVVNEAAKFGQAGETVTSPRIKTGVMPDTHEPRAGATEVTRTLQQLEAAARQENSPQNVLKRAAEAAPGVKARPKPQARIAVTPDVTEESGVSTALSTKEREEEEQRLMRELEERKKKKEEEDERRQVELSYELDQETFNNRLRVAWKAITIIWNRKRGAPIEGWEVAALMPRETRSLRSRLLGDKEGVLDHEFLSRNDGSYSVNAANINSLPPAESPAEMEKNIYRVFLEDPPVMLSFRKSRSVSDRQVATVLTPIPDRVPRMF